MSSHTNILAYSLTDRQQFSPLDLSQASAMSRETRNEVHEPPDGIQQSCGRNDT